MMEKGSGAAWFHAGYILAILCVGMWIEMLFAADHYVAGGLLLVLSAATLSWQSYRFEADMTRIAYREGVMSVSESAVEQ